MLDSCERPRRHFCTLFDRNFLLKGLALHRSLVRHGGDGVVLHALCMDDETHAVLSRLAPPGLRPIRLDDFEDAALRAVRPTRTPVEYFWTITPSLPLWVLDHEPGAELVTYVDADLWFFDSPERVLDELGRASIGIHEHRFPADEAHRDGEAGRFNVGWVSFRRDEAGLACARRWRAQCLEWCFYRREDGKLGDQMYLDDWPRTFPGAVRILRGKGVALAPWNSRRYALSSERGRVLVDGEPLLFFHFSRLRLYTDGGQRWSDVEVRPREVALVYRPYVAELRRLLDEVRAIRPGFDGGLDEPPPGPRWRAHLRDLVDRAAGSSRAAEVAASVARRLLSLARSRPSPRGRTV